MDEGRVPDHTVTVVPHDPIWRRRYAAAAEVLRRILPEALAIEHIGSTAVPGLAAKDTVDVLVVLDDLALVRERAPALAVAGFDLRLGAPVTTADHLFLRRVVRHHRTHHVHALLPSSPEVEEYLLFRDYLRADTAAMVAYEAEKSRLAEVHGDDRTAYVAAKPVVVERLLADAREWAARTGWTPTLAR
jgi:GrpB-like predicted nucleotidyltransferase (UPF0157 family)